MREHEGSALDPLDLMTLETKSWRRHLALVQDLEVLEPAEPSTTVCVQGG